MEQRAKERGREGVRHMDICGENLSDEENSRSRNLKVRACL